MKSLMMFFGSCGHTTVSPIDDETWLRFTTKPGYGPFGETPPNRSRTGSKTRMVYVYPDRYTQCEDCTMADIEGLMHERAIDIELPSLADIDQEWFNQNWQGPRIDGFYELTQRESEWPDG